MNSAHHVRVAVSAALAGTTVAAATAVSPVAPAPVPANGLREIQLLAEDIYIDFVRHGETYPPGDKIAVASNGLPGYPLSGMPGQPPIDPADNGELQQAAVGNLLAAQFGTPTGGILPDGTTAPVGGVAGIYGGYEQRMIETAHTFLINEGYSYTPEEGYGALSNGYTPLDGFDEIGGGIFVHDPPGSIGTYLSELIGLAWVFGLELPPVLGSNDWIGMEFEQNFGGAVATAYNDTVSQTDPIISATGHLTDVVFSGEGAILAWTLMNVNNPDLAILLPLALKGAAGADLLPTTGQVEIHGNPTDGWTLVSFGGHAIPTDPGLLTELVVDFRHLITAPQMAAWNLLNAVLTGDPSTIGSTLWNGATSVGGALLQFPVSVASDVATETYNVVDAVFKGTDVFSAIDSSIIGLAP